MSKSVFLYVSGGDYSANDFEQNYNPQEVYEEMVNENKTFEVIKDENSYIEIEIKEFNYVPNDFLEFVRFTLMDYDDSKHSNIYEVKPL